MGRKPRYEIGSRKVSLFAGQGAWIAVTDRIAKITMCQVMALQRIEPGTTVPVYDWDECTRRAIYVCNALNTHFNAGKKQLGGEKGFISLPAILILLVVATIVGMMALSGFMGEAITGNIHHDAVAERLCEGEGGVKSIDFDTAYFYDRMVVECASQSKWTVDLRHGKVRGNYVDTLPEWGSKATHGDTLPR